MASRAALVGVLAFLVAGCGGGLPSPQERQSASAAAIPLAQRLGGAPGTAVPTLRGLIRELASTRTTPLHSSVPRKLYVSDLAVQGGGILIFKNRTYKQLGSIGDGTNAADGVWVDKHGNLYAANADGGNATEYAPGATSPTCTYSGLIDPVNVTTDTHGHVFVIDWNYGSGGAVVKYDQCKSAFVKRYSFQLNTAPTGAAIDAKGNMFVAYYASKAPPSQQGAFEVFPAGSDTPKPLGATVVFPGSIVLDQNSNLIVADQGVSGSGNGAVDVIAPPYKHVTLLRTGMAQPIHLTLNKSEKLLFVNSFDFSTPTVWVMNYPSGTIETTLGAANGLAYPLGVADSPNAVF